MAFLCRLLSMRNWAWRVLRWFLFRCDPETAHWVTVAAVKLGVQLGGASLRMMSGAVKRPEHVSSDAMPQVFGMSFASRVGLAAGFDKNCEILAGLPSLGFGFAEIGTVTPRPQPGNDQPRLFRELQARSLFNRMGFNNLGAVSVAERLALTRKHLPDGFRVGVNIGKNKDTSAEDAAKDFASAIVPFQDLADYVVINVSSPNTPGLRALQTAAALLPIVASVKEKISRWQSTPPLLLKLAPELGQSLGKEALAELFAACENAGINGWVLTNTLGGTFRDLPGGWSGAKLEEISRGALIEARSLTRLPIISVGGIMSVEEAIERRRAGADLLQIYSGWIYQGPTFPAEIARKTL
jgi:dihydroorotate dehydrogenase